MPASQAQSLAEESSTAAVHGANVSAWIAWSRGVGVALLRRGLLAPESVLYNEAHLKVLYMSGYTNDEALRRAVVDEGAPFIQKPFTLDSLVAKIREVLDVPSS
jgi:hypothetical protein